MVLKQTKKLAGIANNHIIDGRVDCKHCVNASFVVKCHDKIVHYLHFNQFKLSIKVLPSFLLGKVFNR